MANLDIVVPIPKPKTKPAATTSKGGFPPSLPSIKLPKMPAAVAKVQAVITGLVPKIQKVLGVIQNARSQAHAFAAAQTITLKVKQKGVTVFEQKIAPLSTIV
jgi:hypothetical protein